MPVRSPTLTSADHDATLKLMGAVRGDGVLHPADTAGDPGHLFAAVVIGNTTEPPARADPPDEFIAHQADRRQRANAR